MGILKTKKIDLFVDYYDEGMTNVRLLHPETGKILGQSDLGDFQNVEDAVQLAFKRARSNLAFGEYDIP